MTAAHDDPEINRRRHGLLINRGYLRENLGIPLDDADREARAEADRSLAQLTTMIRERLTSVDHGDDLDVPRDGTAFNGIVLRWVREDFPTVRSRWPESTAHYSDDYDTYAWRIQREARAYEESGAARVHLVTASLSGYEAYAKSQRRDPAEQSTRQAYGEWCTTARPDRVQPWPPERNSACWCDSGRKYKKCCAAPAREATRPRI